MDDASEMPKELICHCGVPMKIYKEGNSGWVGCTICKCEVNYDDPLEFKHDTHLLRDYWRAQGMPEIVVLK